MSVAEIAAPSALAMPPLPQPRLARQRHAVDLAAFAAIIVAAIWALVAGAGATGYRWSWGRVPQFILREADGTWVAGPLLNGLAVTLAVVACAFVVMLVVAALTALAGRTNSPVARRLARLYVETVRNTPMLVQLYVLYFVVAPIFGIGRFWTAALALGLFEGAFAAEIIRGALDGVPRHQSESAAALGLGPMQTLRLVILPQALLPMLPPLTGQAVSLIKDSALVGVIAIYDLTSEARTIIADTLMTFEVWLVVAAIYLALGLLVSALASGLERRLRRRGIETAPRAAPSKPRRRGMHLLKKLAAGIVAVGLLLTGAVAARADEAKSVIDEIQSRGVLRVGLDTFVPWAFRDKDGNLIGFEVDVATRLAEDLGVKVEFVPTAWDGIIPALLSGNFDVIIGGLSITPARSLKVNFTDPYASSGLLIAANASTNPGLTSLEDFNKPEIVLAVKRGIGAIDYIKTNLPNAQLRQFDDEAAVFQEVKNGNAAAFIASIPSPNQEVARSNGALYLPFTDPVNASLEAFAVRKGDIDALNVFNNWILLRTTDGWLDERHDYWFNGVEWASLVSQ